MNAKPQRPQKTRSLSFALCLLWSLWFSLSLDAQCWRSVDPRIGSVGVGRTFPGPVMPFGMVKPGPDCGVLPNAGWAPMPERVSGFSQTHVSGTGGGQKYGNILIQPIISNGVRPSPTDYPQRRVTETIELGYYATTYESGIRTEITTNERCAHYRLHFPRHLSPITSRFSLLVDATHFLGKDSVPDLRERQQFVGAEVEVISDHEVVGYSRVRGGWNNGDAYTVYFCLQTDKPFTKQPQQAHPQQTHPQPLPGGRGADSFAASFPNGRSIYSPPSQGGAGGGSVGSLLLSFADTLVNVKVGISYVSTMQARRNIDDHGFDEQLAMLRDAWEQQLQKIQITGSDAQRRMFYTALYHTMLMPIDKTGENPKWTDAPYYDDYYAIWDIYRTSSPLLTLLWPERQVAIINSLLNIYTREGYLPDARSGDCNGRTQGGSNAEVVIADAFVKGLGTVHHLQSTVYSPKPTVYSLQSTVNHLQSTDNKLQSTVNKLQSTVNNLQSIDYSLALEAMLKDGDADPGADHEKHGRGGLNEYKRLGYIPYGIPRAGTRTVEYAYDDYCIAQVARGLGRNDIADEYLRRSGNWRNLWRSDYEWDDVRGYILPRDEEGRWMDSVPWGRSKVFHPLIPYTPVTKVAPWYLPWWDTFFYEALSAEYSLSIPHDVPGLIEACGGKEAFRRRLDLFFERGRYNVGNEPSFLTPCYYHWIGRPDLSTRRIHQIINDNYSDAPDGLPGNDDGGAMSSWLAFHMMGLYPNAGQDYYLLNVPMLDEYTFRLPNDRSLHVTKKAAKAFKVALNGRQLKEARITHEELMEGGELVFQAPTPNPSRAGGGADYTQTSILSAAKVTELPSRSGGVGGGSVVGGYSISFTLNRQFRTWPLSFAWQGDTLNIVCKQTTYRIPRHETEHATGFCWLNPQNDGTIYHHVGGTFLFVSADAVQQLHAHGFFVYDGITWRQIGDSENHVRADIDGTEMWIRLDTSTGLYLVTEMRGNPLGIDWKL